MDPVFDYLLTEGFVDNIGVLVHGQKNGWVPVLRPV